MNYEILLLEAVRKADPNYLAQYIFREFKKAEKDHYSFDEFFNGCLSILKQWQRGIDESLELAHAKMYDLENKIHLSKGTEEQKARAIEQLENEKKTLTIETISIPIRGENYKLGQLPKGSVKVTDIQKLKNALQEVFQLFNDKVKNLPPQQCEMPKPEPKETELSERIKRCFGFFNRNCPRKHKQILNDADFEKLIEWAIWYYENEFKVPDISEPIKVVNTNKTFVQLAFKYLFKELHKSSPYPQTLFEFYQSAFAPFSEDKKSNFEAVKNNDEVKKLMQIDY